MITATIDQEELPEYYNALKALQQLHHTADYTLVHDELKKLLQDCESYTEFGIMQGATLAIPCLNKIPKIRGYDINLDWYNKAKSTFTNYAICNKLNFFVVQDSTLTCDIEPVDLLYIDSLHTYKQLSAELARHGSKANKYIVMHDTQACPTLKKAILEFIGANPEWQILTDCQLSVGYTSLIRVAK